MLVAQWSGVNRNPREQTQGRPRVRRTHDPFRVGAVTTTVPTKEDHMAVTVERSAGNAALRPFSFEFPDADLEDLRARIAATRWPDKETVEDKSQGVQLATIQALARYWLTEHDWRKAEAKLNSVPNFITEIDGLDIHFVHVRSPHEDALPLVVTHGWPGS